MRRDIEIEKGGRSIGSLSFVESPQQLTGTRTASGFEIHLPIIISFTTVQKEDPLPLIGNLRGKVMAREKNSGSLIGVGRVHYDAWEKGGVYFSEHSKSESQSELSVLWTGTFADLAMFEKVRDGDSPRLTIYLSGEFCFLVSGIHPNFKVRTAPQIVYPRHGNIDLTYSKEMWIEMLRRLGIAENVLEAIPKPSSSP